MSAATRLRRLREDAEIIVLERSGYVSFANCGLPYYVGGVIERRSALLLQTPASLAARFRIDVRVQHEVTGIDAAAQRVTVTNLTTGTAYELEYDELVLSPGARPVRPPIPGIERALSLRDIEDTDAMYAAVGDSPRSAVIVGGGFIGVEVAENLVHRQIPTTIVEAMPQLMGPLDPEMAWILTEHLQAHGVTVRLGAQVTAIGADDVRLADGTTLPADLVVAAIGVKPDTALAVAAGAEIGPRGGIVVDDQLRTTVPHVWAVGDAVEKVDALDGENVLIPLANTANRQGRLVADLIAGRGGRSRRVRGTAIVGAFGMAAASTGWSEKRLVAAGRRHEAIAIHPGSHAGYYPGAQTLSIKLLFDPTTDEILGAQAVGLDGADKRIDVIATAMAGGLGASKLADLELSYSPQYGSAKDPVNMLGFIAENLVTGLTGNVQWHDVARRQQEGATVIDVRTVREFSAGAIPGAVNIPVDELRDCLDEVPDGPLIVHCAVGIRAHTAACILAAHGKPAANLSGGYRTWAAGQAATRAGAGTGGAGTGGAAERVAAPA